MLQNLEQLRAAHALLKTDRLDRQAINKIPALIINNGLLAAAAFSLGESRSGMRAAFEATTDYLKQRGHLASNTPATPDGLIDHLSRRAATSADLQRATSEALAYLAYLKRFAKKGRGGDDTEE